MDSQEEAKLVLKIYIRVLLYVNNYVNNNKINTFLVYLNDLVTQNKKRENQDDDFKSIDQIFIESIASKNLLKYEEECKKSPLSAAKPGPGVVPGPGQGAKPGAGAGAGAGAAEVAAKAAAKPGAPPGAPPGLVPGPAEEVAAPGAAEAAPGAPPGLVPGAAEAAPGPGAGPGPGQGAKPGPGAPGAPEGAPEAAATAEAAKAAQEAAKAKVEEEEAIAQEKKLKTKEEESIQEEYKDRTLTEFERIIKNEDKNKEITLDVINKIIAEHKKTNPLLNKINLEVNDRVSRDLLFKNLIDKFYFSHINRVTFLILHEKVLKTKQEETILDQDRAQILTEFERIIIDENITQDFINEIIARHNKSSPLLGIINLQVNMSVDNTRDQSYINLIDKFYFSHTNRQVFIYLYNEAVREYQTFLCKHKISNKSKLNRWISDNHPDRNPNYESIKDDFLKLNECFNFGIFCPPKPAPAK